MKAFWPKSESFSFHHQLGVGGGQIKIDSFLNFDIFVKIDIFVTIDIFLNLIILSICGS